MRVIGISPLHDSTVAVINDGELEFFFKEERYTREKRESHPFKSLIKALESIKGPVDHACISSPMPPNEGSALLSTAVDRMFNCPVTEYHTHHHLSHAGLAFYNSGFEKSLVFVIDRDGTVIDDAMREAETVFEASYPCTFKTLHKNFWVHDLTAWHHGTHQKLKYQRHSYNADTVMSTVKIYESATTLINEKPLENGKTMGLAAYGKDKPFVNFYENGRPVDRLFAHGPYVLENFHSTIFREYLERKTKKVTEENYEFYADYAYQVQKQTQEFVLKFVKEWVDKTGIKQVCLTGGYALNVVCNGYLVENLPEVEFYFEPLADDSGNSIGAAMHLYRHVSQDKTIHKLKHTFVHGVSEEFDVEGEVCNEETIAQYLASQRTVAVFNGLAESGPRALGNRSILFDPRHPQAKNIVNKIKNREWYRPFAAMILEEDFAEYFETHGLTKAEFMTVSFRCKKPDVIPGVVHVDGSCRVQTVSQDVPHIYKLLKEFKKITGCPVLLNTSFNLAGEPLVETVPDAIKTFDESALNVLWFPEINKKIGN
jgi:carbamoyltransferase